jgi:hypothetical protein
MSSDYDATEFVDGDFEARQTPRSGAGGGAGPGPRAPTREEVDSRVAEKQQKLAELKRKQEELERQKASLEEVRRRQIEFQTGRQEMLQNLTRGLALLEEAEFGARSEAEQMARTLADLRGALSKIEGIHQDTWTQDSFDTELTRALTALENARMEWNSARLRFPLLATRPEEKTGAVPGPGPGLAALPAGHTFGQLCRIGFALTWPLALVGLLALGLLLALLLRHF